MLIVLLFLFIIHFIIVEVTLACCQRVGYEGPFEDNQSYLKRADGSQTVSACNYTNASSYNLPSSDSVDGIFTSRFQAVGGLMEDIPREIECTCRTYFK